MSNTDSVERWLKETFLVYNTEAQDELAQNRCIVTVEEFINVLRTSGHTSWLEHSIIDLALAQLTDKQMRLDCYVLPIPDAQILCQLGLGVFGVDFVEDRLKQVLSDKRKRWIIVPCNDGMMENNFVIPESEQHRVAQQNGSSYENSIEKPAREREVDSTAPSEPRQAIPLGHGAHWGLMIIDTQNQTAHWLDGLLTLDVKDKDGKQAVYIRHMFGAGAAAGKVLCGYDKLLEREIGKFTTSTLKWVPHQHNDNTGAQDGGACGPHMFACLKHIFETPGALNDLHAHFRRGNIAPGNFRRGGRGFNSAVIRKQISDQILERREKEAPSSEPSLHLTSELMDTLGLRITPEKLLQAAQKFRAAASSKENGYCVNVPQAQASQTRHDLQISYEQQWLTDQDNTDRSAILDAAGITNLSQYVQYRLDEGAIFEENGELHPGASRSYNSESNRRTNIYLGRKSYVVPCNDRTIWPPHATKSLQWPNEFNTLPDFANMDGKHIQKWFRRNPDLQKLCGDAKKVEPTTRRAMLHHKFKGTFLGEPDINFENVWYKDRKVFDPKDAHYMVVRKIEDSRVKCGEMRLMMMRHYEDEEAVRRVTKFRSKQSPGTPDHNDTSGEDDDDNDDDNDEAGNGGKQRSGTTSGNQDKNVRSKGSPESDDEGDKYTEAYRSGGSNNIKPGPTTSSRNSRTSTRPDDTSTKNKTAPWSKLTPMPLGIWDFRTMSEAELSIHMAEHAAKLNDPRLQNRPINTISWRAMLFVDISGGRFEDCDDATCMDLWLGDSAVFSKHPRRMGMSPAAIQRAMARRYYVNEVEDEEGDDDESQAGEDTEEAPEDEFERQWGAVARGQQVDSHGPASVAVKRKRGAGDDTADSAPPSKKKRVKRGPLTAAKAPVKPLPKITKKAKSNKLQPRKAPAFSTSTKPPTGGSLSRDERQQQSLHAGGASMTFPHPTGAREDVGRAAAAQPPPDTVPTAQPSPAAPARRGSWLFGDDSPLSDPPDSE